MFPRWIELGVLLLVALTGILVALAVFMVWRRGYRRGWARARSVPPTCPRCGYNLSGLTRCRCPECGTEYKLDQLWRAQLPAGAIPASPDQPRPGRSTDVKPTAQGSSA